MRFGAHEGLMCPLENGVGGLRRVIRCRAGAGGQGSHRGDGKLAGPDRPLGKGVGGLKRNARSVRVWDRVPMKKQDQGGKSSLG